ncbi:MAG: hypothetical protein BJ554DRAFT_2313 [Olpidium bornovanus]|uniref:Uncharacterized protein n=1 Tax=Olpidium bornovanus TaxID=278681 RepID=A0A8H7ZR92_9FUNG|nr:MAG: hypothetical protein BJ554DRAFT_2313 [Olpidium bornovanus]
MGITGQTTQQLQAFNEQQVALGVMADEPAFTDEVERMLKEQDAKSASTPVGSDGAPVRADLRAEIESIRSLRKVLALGVSTLPSVCCYTFHNTHEA